MRHRQRRRIFGIDGIRSAEDRDEGYCRRRDYERARDCDAQT